MSNDHTETAHRHTWLGFWECRFGIAWTIWVWALTAVCLATYMTKAPPPSVIVQFAEAELRVEQLMADPDVVSVQTEIIIEPASLHPIQVGYTVQQRDPKILSGLDGEPIELQPGSTRCSLPFQVDFSKATQEETEVSLTLQEPAGAELGPSSKQTIVVSRKSIPVDPLVALVATLTISVEEIDEGSSSQPQIVATLNRRADKQTEVEFDLGGTAKEIVHFQLFDEEAQPLDGGRAFRFKPGETSTSMRLKIEDDNIVLPDRTLTVSLLDSPDVQLGNPSSGEIKIKEDDKPRVTLTLRKTELTEGGPDDQTVLEAKLESKAIEPLRLKYTVGGTADNEDFRQAFPREVVIEKDETRAEIPIIVRDDDSVELDEDVVFDFVQREDVEFPEGRSFRVEIQDNDKPTVTLELKKDELTEGATDNRTVLEARLKSKAIQPLNLTYTVSGTAKGNDYAETFPGVLTIKMGEDRAEISIVVKDDEDVEDEEFTEFQFDKLPDITIVTMGGELRLRVKDNDTPTVTLTLEDKEVTEGAANSQTRLVARLNAKAIRPLNLEYRVSGADPEDYEAMSGTLTIETGEQSAHIDIKITNDKQLEGREELVFEFEKKPDVILSPQTTFKLSIVDDESLGNGLVLLLATDQLPKNAATIVPRLQNLVFQTQEDDEHRLIVGKSILVVGQGKEGKAAWFTWDPQQQQNLVIPKQNLIPPDAAVEDVFNLAFDALTEIKPNVENDRFITFVLWTSSASPDDLLSRRPKAPLRRPDSEKHEMYFGWIGATKTKSTWLKDQFSGYGRDRIDSVRHFDKADDNIADDINGILDIRFATGE